jgi:hypothetical protein
MYVTSIPNRTSPPAILIRESYRDGEKVKTRTVANITGWPTQRIDVLKKLLRGDLDNIVLDHEVSRQGRAIGALYVLRETARKIGLDAVLGRTSCPFTHMRPIDGPGKQIEGSQVGTS